MHEHHDTAWPAFKALLDVMALGVAAGTWLLAALPHLAALFTVAWLGMRMWERLQLWRGLTPLGKPLTGTVPLPGGED